MDQSSLSSYKRALLDMSSALVASDGPRQPIRVRTAPTQIAAKNARYIEIESLKLRAINDFTAIASAQSAPNRSRNVVGNKTGRAIAKADIHAARVIAAGCLVGAIEVGSSTIILVKRWILMAALIRRHGVRVMKGGGQIAIVLMTGVSNVRAGAAVAGGASRTISIARQ